MQEAVVEPGRRPALQPQQQFAGVDLRRPKGYAAPAPAPSAVNKVVAEGGVGVEGGGDPCPRCASRDTKFCYYNNYNTSQPRHFCKGCRRYWTKGGTLRNVPVGGGTRKKPSSSSSSSSYAAAGADADSKPPAKKKKRRVEAPAPEPTGATAAASAVSDPVAAAAESAKTTTTDGASDITTETAAAAAVPAAIPVTEEEDSDSLAHLLLQPGTDDAAAVALGLGLSDADFPSTAGKEAVLDNEDSFVWPAAYDLGTCWASAGFVDPDPTGVFLNLP